LVDCTQITKNKAGVGAYALNLVKELLKRQNNELKVVLLVQDDDQDFALDQECSQIIRIPANIFRRLPFRLIMEQIYIPWLARKYKIDVIHSLHYSFPLLRTRARKVVTVHDLTSFIMPQVHTRIKRAYFHFFIRCASRLSDTVIFDSDSTKNDWNHFFPNCSKPSFAVPLGKSQTFRPDISRETIRLVLEKCGLVEPYILFVGTIEPRKNLVRLVSAFAQIADQFSAHNLVIAGMKGWMYDELFDLVGKLELQSRVIFTGFVAEEDKPPLIAGAEVFVYPSLYEGFGIPVLEALACGTPTITSNISSLLEVAGDAALLTDPTNTEGIAASLRKLLTDANLRESLRQKSVHQASLFDWGITADATIHVYKTAVLKHCV
jgi:glycosyltransferase involved in cell wall biosynthesis